MSLERAREYAPRVATPAPPGGGEPASTPAALALADLGVPRPQASVRHAFGA